MGGQKQTRGAEEKEENPNVRTYLFWSPDPQKQLVFFLRALKKKKKNPTCVGPTCPLWSPEPQKQLVFFLPQETFVYSAFELLMQRNTEKRDEDLPGKTDFFSFAPLGSGRPVGGSGLTKNTACAHNAPASGTF
jgi:hypothetical protein